MKYLIQICRNVRGVEKYEVEEHRRGIRTVSQVVCTDIPRRLSYVWASKVFWFGVLLLCWMDYVELIMNTTYIP